MKHLRMSNGKKTRRTLAVSEAVGTILMLGISVLLAGWVAIWSSTIKEGEESVYVDLWASTSGDQLIVVHRGGDSLDGEHTELIIRDTSGTEHLRQSYYYPPTRTDRTWNPGEEITLTLGTVPSEFDLVITTVKPNGISMVVLSNRLVKGGISMDLPDLAVTGVRFMDRWGDDIENNILLEINNYYISVEVKNNREPIDGEYFAIHPSDWTITNLRVFDSVDDLTFSFVELTYYLGADEVDPASEAWDSIIAKYTWEGQIDEPRTLGEHILSVKVIPPYSGEMFFNNNFVEKRFIVDKEVPQYVLTGPDPGIYDIYFSNNVPKSGESVVVTVVIQNSGEEPIFLTDHVNLVVSTWEPKEMELPESPGASYTEKTFDWMVDYDGHYGQWRSDDAADGDAPLLVNDDTFPTCIVTDIQLLPGAYLFLYFTMEARVEVPGGFQWVYASIDIYDTEANPQAITLIEGDSLEKSDNTKRNLVQVLPRILLVDDDAASTKSTGDMTSSVLEALVGSGVNVDNVFIAQKVDDAGGSRDAPAFKYDKSTISAPAMEDFDIVIWVTGYTYDGLTNYPRDDYAYGGNIQEIMDFMDNNRYFLLVGSDPIGGLSSNFDSGKVLDPATGHDPNKYADAMKFVYRYLGIQSFQSGVDLPLTKPSELIGTDNGIDSITPIISPAVEYTIVLENQPSGNGGSTHFQLRSVPEPPAPVPEGDRIFETPIGVLSTRADIDDDEYVAVRAWSSPEGTYDAQYRSVVIGFDVSQIKYLNEKINLFAAVLKWFDWEIKVGRDLAVTGMEMYILREATDEMSETEYVKLSISEGEQPKYLDTIEIEATIRNNGFDTESSSVVFFVTGPDGMELPVTPNIIDPRPEEERPTDRDDNPSDINMLPGGGTQVVKWKLWLAIGVGTYYFRVEVDPYHLISEISEENNDITYSTSTTASFITQNNILVVDDDTSNDNFFDDAETAAAKAGIEVAYPQGEPSEMIAGIIDEFDYDYEIYTVKNQFDADTNTWTFDSSLTKLDLKRFNSVIWITGDSGNPIDGRKDTLTDNDIMALMDYLDGNYDEANYLPVDHYENVMFIGQYLVPDLSSFSTEVLAGTFLDQYLGLTPLSATTIGTGTDIKGRSSGDLLSDLYVGMEFFDESLDYDFSFQGLILDIPDISVEEIEPVLNTSSMTGDVIISSQHTMEDPELDSENYYRTIVHSWQVTSADHSSAESLLYELIYMPLHLFGTPEDNADLVSRSLFIEFEDEHPAILNSYLVKIEVANLGGASGGGTIRFMDGGTLVKSQYIFLDPDTSITIEATWTPLFAGNREFRVILDVEGDTTEVFDELNNNPVRYIEVFFFWDDLESGAGNWQHDAVMAMINGESPLDYLDVYETNPSTNIVNNWDLSMSKGLTTTDNTSHSAPISFWLKEAKGAPVRANVILGLVIDNSPSMFDRKDGTGKTWLQVAVESSMVLVDSLSDDSLVCVWIFSGSLAKRQLPLTSLTGTGRTVVRNSLNSIANGQMTQIWDGIGSAYTDVKAAAPTYPRHTPAVVALSDGADYKSSDVSAAQPLKLESASEIWAPWHNMQPESGYPTVKYTQHRGRYTIPYNGISKWYTAGGGSFKGIRKGLLSSDISVYSIGLGLEHFDPPNEPSAAWWPWVEGGLGSNYNYALYTGLDGTGNPAIEAGTTEYNLWRISTTSPKGQYFYTPTPDKLNEIFTQISILLAEEAEMTRAGPVYEENTDKSAVTPAFDLTYASSSYVSFWHKYNMVGGTNGAFLEIGYQDPMVLTEAAIGPVADWDWKYAVPFDGQYSGNLYLGETDRYDSFGNYVRWGWTGLSAMGTFDWEHVKLDILQYVPEEYRGAVRIKFNYTQYGGGTGDGWWIDDVRITVSRDNNLPVTDMFPDMWMYAEGTVEDGTTHSGTHAWYAGGPGRTDLNEGVDNSLYTRPIDLTNARFAEIVMYLRFNIQYAAGVPPDGFRVEISKDNGLSWSALNYGVRTAWGVSGTGGDGDDLVIDGRSFTGIQDDALEQNWVPSGSLTRLVTDLQGYLGNVVILRFRVVTNIDGIHYEDPDMFMGVCIDDIIVYGSSSGATRSDEGRAYEPAETEQGAEKEGALITVQETEAPLPDPAPEDGPVASMSEARTADRELGLWALASLIPVLVIVLVLMLAKRKYQGRH